VKNRLKELRKTRQWSQSDLARALEISRQAVNGFESGKFTPSLEMAFKIAKLFDVAIEEIFMYQEKNSMQNLIEKIVQWLPKGERFTVKAINAVEFAQQQAALSKHSQVEPEHLLYGLFRDSTTTAARLLKENGLTLDIEDSDGQSSRGAHPIEPQNQPKILKISPTSEYVFELALKSVQLKKGKYIETEHLLLGLIQLVQLGDGNLADMFRQYEVDIPALTKGLIEAI
jgi:putative transcriptional regulator